MVQRTTSGTTIDLTATAAVRTATWGFRIAAALLTIGLIISAVRQQALQSSLGTFGTILDETIHFQGTGFIGLAIAAMILTPVVATLTTAVSFFRYGDRRYGGFTVVVLAILVGSVALSQL